MMTRRALPLLTCLALVLVATPVLYAQTQSLLPLMGKNSFSATEEETIRAAIQNDLSYVVLGRDNPSVNGGRTRLLELAGDNRATAEFRTTVSRIIVGEFEKRLPNALAQRNRLSVAIIGARMQNPESVPLLMKFLADVYPGVRYWGAKGLGTEKMSQTIVQGAGGVNVRTVLAALQTAIDKEKDPICTGVMFSAIKGLGTENATDLLIDASAKKAVELDLSSREAVESMKIAVDALAADFDRDIRPVAAGKARIVASLAQILVQTPPCGDALELVTAANDQLARMTGLKTDLTSAVSEVEQQSPLRDSKLIDIVWANQLNWIEILLSPAAKDYRLKSRPKILDWTAAKSAEVVNQQGS